MKRLILSLLPAVFGVGSVAHAAPPSESTAASDAADASNTAPPPSASSTAPPPSVDAPTTRRFALLIGSNDALDDSLTPLRFADDDAARMTEVLQDAGVDVELVTQFDRDSQALFTDLVGRAHPPTRAGLQTAWAAVQGRIEAAKASGDRTEFIVYYSGHGDVGADGQGYLTLQGDKLKRRDLFRTIIGTSPADHNHVLIDACKSEQFVLTRGKGGPWKSDRSARDYGQAVGQYLDKNHLGHFPNTGVVLAHSADQQTHEWERYRGGIFTHQLVSGLRGGADLNGDGHVEYSELGAFVSAANHGVSDPRARLSVVVRPPRGNERHPLITHDAVASRRVLFFERGDRHRYTVEDARGVRVADVRHSGEQPGYLRLPPGDIFLSRMTPGAPEDRQEFALPADNDGVVLATALAFGPATSASRGSLDQAFRAGLFATPYGPGYYSGFTDRTGILAVEEPEWHVEVWKTTGDEKTKVADVVTQSEPTVRVEPDEDDGDRDDDDEDELVERLKTWGDRKSKNPSVSWGSVFVGTSLSPFSATDPVDLSSKRVKPNSMNSCLNPKDAALCSAVRGFDLRWQYSRVRADARYPRYIAYFRSGYEGVHTTFAREGGAMAGDATDVSAVVVPLHLGGQIYLFDDFLLRPYGGMGVGLDVVRVRYGFADGGDTVRRGALLGFALHGGLELRITNYVALSAEARQQWTTRKRTDDVPDFANTGLTFVLGLAVGLPFDGRYSRDRRRNRR